jgi:hypothetical protein
MNYKKLSNSWIKTRMGVLINQSSQQVSKKYMVLMHANRPKEYFSKLISMAQDL